MNDIFDETNPSAWLRTSTQKNKRYKGSAYSVKGDEMNNTLSPMPICDGDRITVYAIPPSDETEILLCIGKIVFLILKNGDRMIRQAVCYDGEHVRIIVRQYNPDKQTYVSLTETKRMFVVKAVRKPINGNNRWSFVRI